MLKWIRGINKTIGLLAGGFVLVAAVLMFMEIVGRAVKIPNPWATEMSVYLIIAVNLLGAANTEIDEGQLRIRVIRGILRKGFRRHLDVVTKSIDLISAIALVYIGYSLVIQAYELGSISVTYLRLPLGLLYALLPVGAGLLSLQYATSLILIVKDRRNENDAGIASER